MKKLSTSYSNVEKIEKIFLIFYWISISISLVISIYIGDIANIGMNFFVFFLTILPKLLQKKFKFNLISEITLMYLLFTYAAIFLGTMHGAYGMFGWWDTMLHTLSGVFIGYIGFLVIIFFNDSKKIPLNMSPLFIALFAFTFAITAGAIWEIYEFSVDTLFGMNTQHSIDTGVLDTMKDIITDTAGALFASISGYLALKENRKNLIYRLIVKFMDKNSKNKSIDM